MTGSIQTILVFADGLTKGGAILRNFSIASQASVIRTLTLYLIPSGGSAADKYVIFNDKVFPGATTIVGGPWFRDSLAFMQGVLDGADTITVTPTSAEEYLAQ